MSDALLTKERIGLDRITPSMLACYEECPRLFYYQDWLGLKMDEDRLHMDFGDAIHKALAWIHIKYDNNFGGAWMGQTFDAIEDEFVHLWNLPKVSEQSYQKYMKTRAGRESGFKSREELYEYFRDDGLLMLKSYWDMKEQMVAEHEHDLSEFEIPLKIEMHNPADPNDKLPIPLSMRIDAINRTHTKMVDFKTSGGRYDEVETRKKIQGQCYAFGHLMNTGQFIGRFDYTVLLKGRKGDDRVQVVKLEYDMADMVAFYQRVKNILTRIANREFERPSHGHPNYCQCLKYEEKLKVS